MCNQYKIIFRLLYKFVCYAVFISCIFSVIGCKKYLDKKPLQTLVVPSTLEDLQALLDGDRITLPSTSPLPEIVSDNYYVTTSDWQSLSDEERLNYVWDKNAFHLDSWKTPYLNPIYYSNVVLGTLPDIPAGKKQNQWNAIKGTALFYRAFAFYQLAQIYAKPYSTSASTDLGIVLKLSSNINEPLVRSTVQQTYDQVLGDLKQAADLLPVSSLYPTRPTKAAAYGLLARTYLSMRDYANAGKYADSCLKQNNTLIDFNNSSVSSLPPFNSETIFYNIPLLVSIMFPPTARIDSSLYGSYNDNDLRKTAFFMDNGDGTFSYNGGYTGLAGFIPFDGIAVDEMYLIRAEAFARQGNKDEAMNDLNTLMKNRWNNSNWVPFTATSADDAKNQILAERRKELIFRGLRWTDIRRLNLEGANIALKRVVNGDVYMLTPNDLRYTLLIPPSILNSSNIIQNPR